MRIVSGKFGGIRLNPVKSDKTRPTTDKVKEALFSILGPYFDGGEFLDLFAGSGAVGIEAVSRGMDHAVLIDRQYQAVKTINENIEKVHAQDNFTVIKGSAEVALAKLAGQGRQFDMVFLDPPYQQQKLIETMTQLLEMKLLKSQAVVICETDNQTELPEKIIDLEQTNFKNYGLTNIVIYQLKG